MRKIENVPAERRNDDEAHQSVRMELIDKRTVSVLTTILLFVAAGAFIYGASRVLIVFLLAILFAYLLEPLVSATQRWTRVSRGSRTLAILEVYTVLCAGLTVLFLLTGPRIVEEAKMLGEALPGLFEKLSSGQIALQIGSSRGWSSATQFRLQQFLADHSNVILSWVGALGSRAAAAASNAVWIVLIPILAVFFLKDGRTFSEDILKMVERRQQRQFLTGITDDLNEMLAHYIRMQLILSGLSIVAYMAVLSFLRVPYALAIGLFAGLLEFIPVVGPLLGAAIILGVAFLANYHHLLIVALFLAGWRILQDYVTTPHLIGAKLQLHPLTVVFAVLVGAEIGGVIGVYLSIPIAAALRIVWKRWQRVYAGQPNIRAA
jgi:predicted PurR-regulated permease PerM